MTLFDLMCVIAGVSGLASAIRTVKGFGGSALVAGIVVGSIVGAGAFAVARKGFGKVIARFDLHQARSAGKLVFSWLVFALMGVWILLSTYLGETLARKAVSLFS